MPEMPEVETIARKLRRTVIGKRITSVSLSGLPLRRPFPPAFRARLRGRKIARIHRRGKYLIAELEPRAYWLIHLGMSGRLYFDAGQGAIENHTHAVIRFSDRSTLRYCDHRRFGLMLAYQLPRLQGIPELAALGPDPLSRRFAPDWLLAKLQQSRQEVKSFLLDQHKIAGLGNIYVCEALHRAGIHPLRRCQTLGPVEAGKLQRAIRRVVREAIRNGGTTFSDFMDSNRERGRYQRFLRVYQREGRRCRRCRASIVRIQHGNRSSFLCPGCQPESPDSHANDENGGGRP